MGPAAGRYAMKPVAEPDAGNRHVRFDERGWETGRLAKPQATASILDSTSLHPGHESQLLRQKPREPRHEEARVAAGLVERVAQPIVSGTLHHAAAGEKTGLLEGFEEGLRMRPAVDQVVLGAVGEQHRGLVVCVRC